MVSSEPPSAALVREVMTVNPNGPPALKTRAIGYAKDIVRNGRAQQDER